MFAARRTAIPKPQQAHHRIAHNIKGSMGPRRRKTADEQHPAEGEDGMEGSRKWQPLQEALLFDMCTDCKPIGGDGDGQPWYQPSARACTRTPSPPHTTSLVGWS